MTDQTADDWLSYHAALAACATDDATAAARQAADAVALAELDAWVESQACLADEIEEW